ncbi:MAG: Crp/Fnr family transcriptional regulator [Betaproteobacteria bacterium]|nr:Crp/Fnr family transcriptional regulator [Betaproteobacteria bacterium]
MWPTLRRVSAGMMLLRRGDPTFGIFHVAAGRLRMQRVTPDGGTVTLHVARPGELFAEASLFADRYQCDVIAEIDSEVWLYPKEALTRRLRDDPDSLWAFAAGLARGLHGLRQRYEMKQIRSAPERLLQLLRLRCDGDGRYRSCGALKDLAAELGLSHEALYRALATLERKGVVVRSKEQLRIVSGRAQDQTSKI